MTYGLSTAAPASRGITERSPEGVSGAAWKKIDEQCRLRLVEQALTAPQPMIGGFPIAL